MMLRNVVNNSRRASFLSLRGCSHFSFRRGCFGTASQLAFPASRQSPFSTSATATDTTGESNNIPVQKDNRSDFAKVARIGNVRSDGQSLRFYKQAQTVALTNAEGKRMYTVTLDDRPVLSPAEHPFNIPTRTLADAIALEWQSQQKYIRPFTMPLMTLACTSIDRVPLTRDVVVGGLLQHFQTDTLCFRACPQTEKELLEKQQTLHDPLIKWFASAFNIGVSVTEGGALSNPQQNDSAVNVLRWYLFSLNDWELGALDATTTGLRSLITAIALKYYHIDVDKAIDASRVEEEHQAERWGDVPLGQDLDRADLRVKISAAAYMQHCLCGDATVPKLP